MKIATQQLRLIGIVNLTSVACAPEIPAPEEIQAVRDYQTMFVCDGNQSAHVRFARGNAVLDFQGVSATMIQQPTSDGFRYTDGGQILIEPGYELMRTDGKGTVHHCRGAKAASPKGDTAFR